VENQDYDVAIVSWRELTQRIFLALVCDRTLGSGSRQSLLGDRASVVALADWPKSLFKLCGTLFFNDQDALAAFERSGLAVAYG
jgi:hypothetical protein